MKNRLKILPLAGFLFAGLMYTSPALATTDYCLSGFGTAGVNGHYSQVANHGGYPAWQNDNGNWAIWNDTSGDGILTGINYANPIYYIIFNPNYNDNPIGYAWSVYGSGTSPAGTVTSGACGGGGGGGGGGISTTTPIVLTSTVSGSTTYFSLATSTLDMVNNLYSNQFVLNLFEIVIVLIILLLIIFK